VTSTTDNANLGKTYEARAVRPWTSLYVTSAAPPAPDALTPLDLFHAVPREAAAIFYFDAVLTYADVDRLSDQLAHGSPASAWGAATALRSSCKIHLSF
jgi:long-chain acyl-CoA synthetase